MTIDEAIAHAREVAEGCPAENRDCAYQHDKLADRKKLRTSGKCTGKWPRSSQTTRRRK